MAGFRKPVKGAPKTTITAPDKLLIKIKLAKVWGCKPSEVLKEQTDDVITALEHEKFLGDFESMAYQIAREENGNR